jgi:crotonobetainyl-CoA:carnitine CoA-transferase CaiB-like acyl-CoA transferase
VQSSLLEAQIALMDFQAARYLVDGEVPQSTGNDHPTVTPMGVVATRDGHTSTWASGATRSGGTLHCWWAGRNGERTQLRHQSRAHRAPR